MKKIFRMALVFALAGATLMYTGCTKDYDEDINGLNTQVANLTSQHAADVAKLSGDISSAVSSLQTAYKAADSAIETAYKAADSALEDAFKAADTELANAIAANKADIAANKAAIEANAALLDAYKKLIDNNAAAIAVNAAAIDALEAAVAKCATKDELAAAVKAAEEALAATKASLDAEIAKCATKDELAAAAKAAEEALAAAKAELEASIAKSATKDELAAAVKAAEEALDAAKAALEAEIAKCATKEELASAVADLKAEIAKCATKEELTALKGEFETKLATLETTLKDYVKDELGKVSTDLTNKINALEVSMKTFVGESVDAAKAALQTEFDGKIATANKALDDAKAILLSELRSIVFVPELYYAGIEATEYTWTWITPAKMVNADGRTVKVNDVEVSFPKTSEIYAVPVVEDGYGLSQLASAQYNINPSSFDVKKASWELNGEDYRYVVRADEKAWKPVFKSISNEAGVATVRYEIANPECLPTTIYQENKNLFDASLATVNQLESALQAEPEYNQTFKPIIVRIWDYIDALINGKPVEGEAIAPTPGMVIKYLQEEIDNLSDAIKALDNKTAAQISGLQWQVNAINGRLFSITSEIANLYYLASQNYKGTGYVPVMNLTATLEGDRKVASDYEAIVSDPEAFSALAFDAKSDYETNVFQFCKAGEHLYLSALEAIANEPSVAVAYDKNLALDFVNIHMFDFRNGEYETTLAELQKVYPELSLQYSLVEYTMGQNETAESAYGKIEDGKFFPMCVDENGKQVAPKDAKNGGISAVGRTPVVLVKLFDGKNLVLAGYFKVEIVKEVGQDTINIPSFGKFPYICGPQKGESTWAQFSSLVVEYLGTTYAEFVNEYDLVNAEGVAEDLEAGDAIKAQIFVKDGNKLVPAQGLGTITYNVDVKGTTVNDAFTWDFDKAVLDKIGEGKSQTVYVKFVKGAYVEIYVSFTIEVAKKAAFNFGDNKIANEWYDEIDGDVMGTVKVNVHVPSDGDVNLYDGAVLDYSRALDHYFIGYTPDIKLAEGVDAIYSTVAKEKLTNNYIYSFSASQPKINGVQFVINNDADKLYAGSVKAENLIASIEYVEVGEKTVQVIKYNNGDVAKKFLNLYAYSATKQEEMLWANIHVDVTYGDCKIPAGKEDFHARFLRPLEITWGAEKTIEESSVGGANINVVDFLSGIKDWNHQNVIVKKNGKNVENVIANVNMYKYYGFQTLTIDLDGALRDGWDKNDATKLGKVKEITPAAKLTLNVENPINIATLTGLDNAVINYKNDEAYIKEFNLYFPVKVAYSWGEISGTMKVSIKPTEETKEK